LTVGSYLVHTRFRLGSHQGPPQLQEGPERNLTRKRPLVKR
jgi:hypothetical protein